VANLWSSSWPNWQKKCPPEFASNHAAQAINPKNNCHLTNTNMTCSLPLQTLGALMMVTININLSGSETTVADNNDKAFTLSDASWSKPTADGMGKLPDYARIPHKGKYECFNSKDSLQRSPVLFEVDVTWNEGDVNSSGQRTNLNIYLGNVRIFSDTQTYPGGNHKKFGTYKFAVGPTSYWNGPDSYGANNANSIRWEVSRPDGTGQEALSAKVSIRHKFINL
jgi:hypothetical protein